ncbi:MAG: rhodanese-like domain-containing protein [Chloroflexia bacterium]|nr:rhodanese-like domain-containing protein [Chloroflexia bacterium]
MKHQSIIVKSRRKQLSYLFGVQYIHIQKLKAQIDNNGFFLLVDCREEDEFSNEHITKAMNIPRGLLEFSNKLENKNERIFLYSDSLNRAVLGAAALQKLDYKRVFVLKDGFNSWKIKFPKEIEKSKLDEETKEESGCG